MVGVNRVTVKATVAQAPAVRILRGGVHAASFLAVIPSPPEGFPDVAADVIPRSAVTLRFNVWGDQAEQFPDALEVGTVIVVAGTLTQRIRDGLSAMEIDVDVLGPSIDDDPVSRPLP